MLNMSGPWGVTFVLQVGDGVGQDGGDDGLHVLLSDAVKQTGVSQSGGGGQRAPVRVAAHRDTHYCRLTPNCCVGRGGRGGGVFTGGGGRPF